MKKLTLLLFILMSVPAFAQTTAVPDANFEQALIDLGHDTGSPDGSVLTANISGLTGLAVNYKGINDLTGIEDFVALTYLDCRNNSITGLDVSSSTSLTDLLCSSNQLTSLDVTNNTALISLRCGYNQISALDMSANVLLEELYCHGNQLTGLDLSSNTALFMLEASDNQLTDLELSSNTALTDVFCSANQITSLDLSTNTVLVYLSCYQNQLTCLNVKNGNNLNVFSGGFQADMNSLSCIEVDDPTWATANWTAAAYAIDPGVTFSTNCSNACSNIATGLEEYSNQPKKLIRIIDYLGRETTFKPNTPLIYQYDDGSVEKVMEVW